MRVVVVGAGIGGLTLAQALHRSGDDVQVFDRDPAVTMTGGYRLHLDAPASAALRRRLPAALYHALQASSAAPETFRQFRSLVSRSDPHSPAFAFHAADPAADLTPWRGGRITALGDAVHAMPPTGGRAAATAIRGADQLAARLSQARADAAALPAALRAYEAAMAAYAPAAIRESLGPLRWIRASSGPVATVAARAVLPLAAACRAGLGRVRRAR